jgi:KipI family sensor histidine kinase inhibitor
MTFTRADRPFPILVPLGEDALLVRFGAELTDAANISALEFARLLAVRPIAGVLEVVPSLVSVLLRYDPLAVRFEDLAGQVRLLAALDVSHHDGVGDHHEVHIRYGGETGPDLESVAAALNLSPEVFIAHHRSQSLRVLAVGFAPGFLYCGFHGPDLTVPRRREVRPGVPPGSVLFAVGQTAITATTVPTGWHWIGSTDLRNFDSNREPPVSVRAGDHLTFAGQPA